MHAREDFPVRLERTAPRGGVAGCALILGILLLAIGALPVYMTIKHDEPGSRTFYYLIGGGFGAVGLLLIYSGIQQSLAMSTPETIVYAAAMDIRRGTSVDFLFHQDGPVSLESLRANLVGEERWATFIWRKGTRTVDWHTKHLGTFNFLDHPRVDIGHSPLEMTATLHVPSDVQPTREESGDDRRSVTWTIEVWGKVRRRADFMHPFRVTVK